MGTPLNALNGSKFTLLGSCMAKQDNEDCLFPIASWTMGAGDLCCKSVHSKQQIVMPQTDVTVPDDCYSYC